MAKTSQTAKPAALQHLTLTKPWVKASLLGGSIKTLTDEYRTVRSDDDREAILEQAQAKGDSWVASGLLTLDAGLTLKAVFVRRYGAIGFVADNGQGPVKKSGGLLD